MKRKLHAEAQHERSLKKTFVKIGPHNKNECVVILRPRNLEDSVLEGIVMDEIPKDYLVLHNNKVAIQDKSTKEIVLLISFTKFEDIETSKEYEDLEKLTMSLSKLRKGGSGYIKNNKAQVSGKMFALGWRGGMDKGYTMGHYVMGRSIRNSETTIDEWEKNQVELVKWIADFYQSRFMELAPNLHVKTVDEALEVGVLLLGQTEFTNLEQNSVGFSSTLTYSVDDFYNTFHQDQDHSSYAYGMWAPTIEQDGRLAKISDGFYCYGGHFVVPSYKLYVDFGCCDGIVEIIWQAKTDFHATSLSRTKKGFTRVGTSAQIPKSLVDRVKFLTKIRRNGKDVNPQIRGLQEIVEQNKQKLQDNR